MTTPMNALKATPTFNGRIIMIGCGSIGQAVLPVIGRHLEGIHGRMTVLSANESGRGITERCGAKFIHCNLTPSNYRAILKNHVRHGDLMLNLSVDIFSLDLIRFCGERGALYIDTSIEPWPGLFDNHMLKLHQRTKYAIRAKIIDLAAELGPDAPTAVVDHGANPGLVSHFVKRALINLDRILRNGNAKPSTREEWANLARDLKVSTIQISERDTQASQRPKRQGEFINTWSIDGFVDELMQPAELSFGTFEKSRLRGGTRAPPRFRHAVPGASRSKHLCAQLGPLNRRLSGNARDS